MKSIQNLCDLFVTPNAEILMEISTISDLSTSPVNQEINYNLSSQSRDQKVGDVFN